MLYHRYISHQLEVGSSQVDAIHTDFSKAFDTVSHSILIKKLASIGIGGTALAWLASYLHGRTMSVKCFNVLFTRFDVTSGVPQGSHLGPILFNLFINDISEAIVHSKFLLFADDLKIYRSIRSPMDGQLLQDDLSNVALCCLTNRMQLNLSKCHVMRFHRSLYIKIQFHYSINGKLLDSVQFHS